MDEERLRELAEEFGNVLSLKVVTGESGCSKGFGFVSYETPEQAQQAVTDLCGKEWNGKKLYAARAQKKAERQMDLKSQFEKKKSERISRYQRVNLYVKNLDDTIDDGRLREEFSAYGTITSAKVIMDDNHNSKGFGFVCFSSPKEATKAITGMNGRTLVSKPLYVALAQRKEERKAQLAAQHMQRIAGLRMQQAAGQPVGRVFPKAGAFYMQPLAQAGQRPFFPTQMQQVRPRWQPTQAQQQVRPSGIEGIPGGGKVSRARGMRQVPPRGVPGQQSQPTEPGGAGQRLGMGQPPQVRRRPGGMQAQRQPFKFGQNVRKQPEGHPGTVAMQSQDPVQQAIHIPGREPLNSRELAAASPQEQKQIIWERLYPLIQSIHPDEAGKITDMMLDIDNAELLHMLESCKALAAKAHEVVSVLRAHSAKEKSAERSAEKKRAKKKSAKKKSAKKKSEKSERKN